MIANITIGKKAASMILYNEKKVKKGKAIKLDSSSKIMAIPEAAIDVLDELSSKTKTEDANVQISLSLAIGENVSDETFKNIARDYLKSTGFGDCPFVVYRHHDTEHQHIHICTSIMTHQEKKVDMYYNYIKSQKATRELEKKYGLKLVSSVKPKKANQAIKGMKEYRELLASIDLDRGRKSDIRKIVSKGTSVILQQYKPTTLPETKKLYASLGIDLKEVNNDDGSHRGYVFRLSDRANTPAIKASDLYMTFTKDLLERNFDKNQSKKQKCSTKRIARAVQTIQKDFDSINTADFERVLREKNILPMFDRYKDGRVYGLSFFDEKTGFIFKASEVGKEFSHGNMSGFFGDDKETKKSQQKLLEDTFYALYNEQKNLGNRTSALNFANREDTLGNLIAALRKSGANAENIEKIAVEYLSEKTEKLEKAAGIAEERRSVEKALNECYQKNLNEYLGNYPGVTASDYANAQFEAEKGEYVDHVRDSFPFQTLSEKNIEAMVGGFIEEKVREEHLKPLKDHFWEVLPKILADGLNGLNNLEKITFLDENKQDIAERFYDVLKESEASKPLFAKYDGETIETSYHAVIDSLLVSEERKAKADIVQEAAAALISGGIEQRIDLYNSYLTDRQNYGDRILDCIPEPDKKLFEPKELDEYVVRHIDRVESVTLPFLELNRDINDKTEQRDRLVADQEANRQHPKPTRLYFPYSPEYFAKYLPLFSQDKDKLRSYVLGMADRLAVSAMAIESINGFFSEQKERFPDSTEHHLSGNTSLDFHNFLLANKGQLTREMVEKLKAMGGLPKDKTELLASIAFSENGLIAKYFDRVENRAIPIIKANTIAKDVVKNVIADWGKTLDSRRIAKNLSDPDRIKQAKDLIKEAIMGDPMARKVFLDKTLASRVEAKINDIIQYHQGFHAQKAGGEVSGTAGDILYTLSDMARNHPDRDGLNTDRNDKRKKRKLDP